VTILPFLLFGGLFLNSNSVPVYFVWLEYLSPIKFGYEAFMHTYWEPQAGGVEVLRMVGMLEREVFTKLSHSLGIEPPFSILCLFLSLEILLQECLETVTAWFEIILVVV